MESKVEDQVHYHNYIRPVIIELPKPDPNLVNNFENSKRISVLETNMIDYPASYLGFYHYIHATKNKMSDIKRKMMGNNAYLVYNKFEHKIRDYDQSIDDIAKTYFTNSNLDILSRAYYKLWELFIYFDLIDVNNKKFVSAHIAEGPGSFVQATINYRDTFSPHSKKDLYYAVTLHPGNERNVPDISEQFTNTYLQERPLRYYQFHTYPKSEADKSKTKSNGDITNPKTIKLFEEHMEDNKADLVTADGGFNWKNEYVQEQEAFRLIVAQITAAIRIQKDGGNFVCKVYETFTITSTKLIAALSCLYDKVYIAKPLTSRSNNSEKYVVCKGFVRNNKIIKHFMELVQDLHDNPTANLINVFTDVEIPRNIINHMVVLNRTIANQQFETINKMYVFAHKEIYNGDEYQDRRDEQINATQQWINIFLPSNKNINEAKEKAQRIVVKSLEKSSKMISQLG